MTEIIKKFNILNKLNEKFLNEIKLLYVFNKNNVLIVTKREVRVITFQIEFCSKLS